MKKKIITILSVILSVAVLLGTATVTANENKARNAENAEAAENAVTTNEAAETENADEEKTDETVYVITNTDGSVKKVLSGSEDGETVTEDKELPFEVNIKYFLDDKEMSADEIAGKSGKVKVRFDYVNKQKSTVMQGMEAKTYYVPYVMVTGMMLSNDTVKNVETVNAKVLGDGSRTIVAGVVMPGMQENLGIDSEEIEIPSYIEVTCDADKFEIGMTITLATNSLFNEIETDELDKADDLLGKIDELSDGMQQLIDGSGQLYDGLETLLEKSNELSEGVTKLADGSATLKQGAAVLDGGATQIKNGASELVAGLNTLKSNNEALTGGAKTVFDTLLQAATTQLTASGISVPALTVDNYSAVLTNVISSLEHDSLYNQLLAGVTDAVEAKRGDIEAAVTDAVKEQVKAGVTEAVRQSTEEQLAQLYPEANADYIAYLAEKNLKEEATQQTIASMTDAKLATAEIQAQISAITEQKVQQTIAETMASDEIQGKIEEGAAPVVALKTSLDTYKAFYMGVINYTNGVSDATSGASKLKSGISDLKDGTSLISRGSTDLNAGLVQLEGNMPVLKEGVAKLSDGSKQLSDGLVKFDKEGVSKLVSAAEDGNKILDNFKGMLAVSKNYRSFIKDIQPKEGSVKFICRTEAVKIK